MILIGFFIKDSIVCAKNENRAEVSSLQSVQHVIKHTLRASPSISTSSDSNKYQSNTKNHHCTTEEMKNLDWINFNDERGFLCGPKSHIDGYSVTMLPRGMYFYHGSKTLPQGKIPGGHTKGKNHYFLKFDHG